MGKTMENGEGINDTRRSLIAVEKGPFKYGIIVWKNKKAQMVFSFKSNTFTKRYGIGGIMEEFAIKMGIKTFTLTEKAKTFIKDNDVSYMNVIASDCAGMTFYTLW